jgi:hypothetical protein
MWYSGNVILLDSTMTKCDDKFEILLTTFTWRKMEKMAVK